MMVNLQSLSGQDQGHPDTRRQPLPFAGGHTWKDWTMSNPVVLITGALTGIGRATAVAFAKQGAKLVVSGRHEDAGQELATELGKLGAEAEFLRADVRRDDDVRDLVDRTAARFGPLDIALHHPPTHHKPA